MTQLAMPNEGELRRLLGLLCANELGPQDAHALTSLLDSDASARELYVRYIQLHAELWWRFDEPGELAEAGKTDFLSLLSGNSAQSVEREVRVAGKVTSQSTLNRWTFALRTRAAIWFLAIVTNLLLVFLLALAVSPHMRARMIQHWQEVVLSGVAPAEAEPVAKLVRCQDCVWEQQNASGEKAALIQGALLEPQTLQLKSGIAELQLHSGTEVTLEGPCRFEIVTPMQSFMRQGKLLAKVPREAIGFRVTTPSLEIVDLGTVFAVDVDESGSSEVHVVKGAVDVASIGAENGARFMQAKLTAGQNLRFDTGKDGVVPVRYSASDFAGSQPVIEDLKRSLPLKPVQLVSTFYNQVHLDNVPISAHLPRKNAFVSVTNGVIQQYFKYRDGYDTFSAQPKLSATDFAGLLYGRRVRVDKLIVSMGGQAFDGGSWEAEPHVFLLQKNVDTDQMSPESDPVHWKRVPARLVAGPGRFDEDVDKDPGATLIFDLTDIPDVDRTAFGWAVGGVDGDGDPDGNIINGKAGFILLTELAAFGMPMDSAPAVNPEPVTPKQIEDVPIKSDQK